MSSPLLCLFDCFRSKAFDFFAFVFHWHLVVFIDFLETCPSTFVRSVLAYRPVLRVIAPVLFPFYGFEFRSIFTSELVRRRKRVSESESSPCAGMEDSFRFSIYVFSALVSFRDFIRGWMDVGRLPFPAWCGVCFFDPPTVHMALSTGSFPGPGMRLMHLRGLWTGRRRQLGGA